MIAIGDVVAFLTLIAICVQAWVYYGQLREMEKSTHAASEAARIAQESLEITKRSIEKSDAQHQSDQRAWITVLEVRFEKPPTKGKTPVAIIELKNSGQTPATIQLKTVMELSEGKPSVYRDFSQGAQGSIMVLAPNGSAQGRCLAGRSLSEEESVALLNGSSSIYVMGRIDYFDVFEKPHFTIFCDRATGAEVIDPAYRMVAHSEGNEMN